MTKLETALSAMVAADPYDVNIQVALMFLVRAEVCHERLWAEWFQDVVGLVPSPVAAAAACCGDRVSGAHKAFDSRGDLTDQAASSTALPAAVMNGNETSGFEGIIASQVCSSQHHRLPKQSMA